MIKLDNFQNHLYGVIKGEIKNISISPDTEGNYVLYLSLPNGTKTSYGHIINFEQELLGTAEIVTDDLSIAERMFFRINEFIKIKDTIP